MLLPSPCQDTVAVAWRSPTASLQPSTPSSAADKRRVITSVFIGLKQSNRRGRSQSRQLSAKLPAPSPLQPDSPAEKWDKDLRTSCLQEGPPPRWCVPLTTISWNPLWDCLVMNKAQQFKPLRKCNWDYTNKEQNELTGLMLSEFWKKFVLDV